MNRLLKTLSTCHLSREQLVSLLEPHLYKQHDSALPWVDVAKRVLTRAADASSEVLLGNAVTIITMYLGEAVRRGMKKPNLSHRYSEELSSLLAHLHFTMEDDNLPPTETHNLSALILAAIIDTKIAAHRKGDVSSIVNQIFMKLTFVFGNSQEQVLDALLHCRTLIHPSSRRPSVLVPLIKRIFSTLSSPKAMSPELYLKYLLLGKLWLFMTEKRELSQTRTYIARVLRAPGSVREWGESRGIPWLALARLNTRTILKNMTLLGALETFYGRGKEAAEPLDTMGKKDELKGTEDENGPSNAEKSKKRVEDKGDGVVPEKLYSSSIDELVTDDGEEDFVKFEASDTQRNREGMIELNGTEPNEEDGVVSEGGRGDPDTKQGGIGRHKEIGQKPSDIYTEVIHLSSDEESDAQRTKGGIKQKRVAHGTKMGKCEGVSMENNVTSFSNRDLNSKLALRTATRKVESMEGNCEERELESYAEKGEKRKGSEETPLRIRQKKHKADLEVCEGNDRKLEREEEKYGNAKKGGKKSREMMKTKLKATEIDTKELRKETKTQISETLNVKSKKKGKKDKLDENELEITDIDCRAKKKENSHKKGKMSKIPTEEAIRERKVDRLGQPDMMQPHTREINALTDQNIDETTDNQDHIQPHRRSRKSISVRTESTHKAEIGSEQIQIKPQKRLRGTGYSLGRRTGGQVQLGKPSLASPERSEEVRTLRQNRLMKKLQRIRQKSMAFTVTDIEVAESGLAGNDEGNECFKSEKSWTNRRGEIERADFTMEGDGLGADIQGEAELSEGKLRRKKKSKNRISLEAQKERLGQVEKPRKRKKLHNGKCGLEGDSLGKIEGKNEMLNRSSLEVKESCVPRNETVSDELKITRRRFEAKRVSLPKNEATDNELEPETSGFEAKNVSLPKYEAVSDELKITRSRFEGKRVSLPKNEAKNDELEPETSGFEAKNVRLPKNETKNDEIEPKTTGFEIGDKKNTNLTLGRTKLGVSQTERTRAQKPQDSDLEVLLPETKLQGRSSDKSDILSDSSSSYGRSGETEPSGEKGVNASEESLDGSECNPIELSDDDSLTGNSDDGEKALFEILDMDDKGKISTSEESVEGSEGHLEDLSDNESSDDDGKDNGKKKMDLSETLQWDDREVSTSDDSVDGSDVHLGELSDDDDGETSDKKKMALFEILDMDEKGEIGTSEESVEGSEGHLEELADDESVDEDGEKKMALSDILDWDKKEISTSEESVDGSEADLEEVSDNDGLEDGRGRENDKGKRERRTALTEGMVEVRKGRTGAGETEKAAGAKLNNVGCENAEELPNRRREHIEEVWKTQNTGSSHITGLENAGDGKTGKAYDPRLPDADSDSEIEVVLDEVSCMSGPAHQGVSRRLREEAVQREVEKILREDEEELKRQNRKSFSIESSAGSMLGDVKEEDKEKINQGEIAGQSKSCAVGKGQTKPAPTDKTKGQHPAQDLVSKMLNNFYKRKPMIVRKDDEVEVWEKDEKSEGDDKTETETQEITETENHNETILFETKTAENDENQKADFVASKPLTTCTSSVPDPSLEEAVESRPEEDGESIEVLECEEEIDSVLENILMDTGRLTSIQGLRERLLSESRETMKESDGTEKAGREGDGTDENGEISMGGADGTEREGNNENGGLEDDDTEDMKDERDEESIAGEKEVELVEKTMVQMKKGETEENGGQEDEEGVASEANGTEEMIDSEEREDRGKMRGDRDDNGDLDTVATGKRWNNEGNDKQTGKDEEGEEDVKEGRENGEKEEGGDEDEMKGGKEEKAEEMKEEEKESDEQEIKENSEKQEHELETSEEQEVKENEKRTETENKVSINSEEQGESESETSEIHLNLTPVQKTHPSLVDKSLTDTCDIKEEEGNGRLLESFLRDKNQLAGVRKLRKHLLTGALKAEGRVASLGGDLEEKERKQQSGEVTEQLAHKTTIKKEENGRQGPDNDGDVREKQTQSPIHDERKGNAGMGSLFEGDATLDDVKISPDNSLVKIEVKYESLDELTQDDAMTGYENTQIGENESVVSNIKSSPDGKVKDIGVKLETSPRTTRKEREASRNESEGEKQGIEPGSEERSHRKQLLERGTIEKGETLLRGQELIIEMEGEEKGDNKREKELEATEKMVEGEERKDEEGEGMKEKERKEELEEESKEEKERNGEELNEKIEEERKGEEEEAVKERERKEELEEGRKEESEKEEIIEKERCGNELKEKVEERKDEEEEAIKENERKEELDEGSKEESEKEEITEKERCGKELKEKVEERKDEKEERIKEKERKEELEEGSKDESEKGEIIEKERCGEELNEKIEEERKDKEEGMKEKEQKEELEEESKKESEKGEIIGKERIIEKIEEIEGERSKTQEESTGKMEENLGEPKKIMENETDGEIMTEKQGDESAGEPDEKIMKSEDEKCKNRPEGTDEADGRKQSLEKTIEKETRQTKQATDETLETMNESTGFAPSAHRSAELESTLDELTEKSTDGADEAYEASSDASDDSAPRTRRRSRLRKACIHSSASDSDSSPVRALGKRALPLDGSGQHRHKRRRSQSCCDSQSSDGFKNRDTIDETSVFAKENPNTTFTVRGFYDSEADIAQQGDLESSNAQTETSKGRGGSSDRCGEVRTRRKGACPYRASVNKAGTELCTSVSLEKRMSARMKIEPKLSLSSVGKKRTISEPCFSPSTETRTPKTASEPPFPTSPRPRTPKTPPDSPFPTSPKPRTPKTPSEPPFPTSPRPRTPKTPSEPPFPTSPKPRTPETPPLSLSTPNRTQRTISEPSIISDKSTEPFRTPSSSQEPSVASHLSDKSTEPSRTPSSGQTNVDASDLEKSGVEPAVRPSPSFAEEEQAGDDDGLSRESSVLCVDAEIGVESQGLLVDDRRTLSGEIGVAGVSGQRWVEKCTYVEDNDGAEIFEGEEMEVLSTSGIDEDEDDGTRTTPDALDDESDDNAKKRDLLISKKSLRSHIRQLYARDAGRDGGEPGGARKLAQALVKVQRLSEVALTKEVLISPDVSDEECELVSTGVDANALKYPDLAPGNDPCISKTLLSPRGIRSPEKIIPEEQDETALARNVDRDVRQLSSPVKRVKSSANLHSPPSTQLLRKPISEEQEKNIDLPKSAKKAKAQSSPSTPLQTQKSEREENETPTPRKGKKSTSPLHSTSSTPHKPTPDETRPVDEEFQKSPVLRKPRKAACNPPSVSSPRKPTPERKESAKSRDSDLPKSPMRKGKVNLVSAFENQPVRTIQTRRSSREMLSGDSSATDTHQSTKNQSHAFKTTSNIIQEEESSTLGFNQVLEASPSLPDGSESPKRKDFMGDSRKRHSKGDLCKNCLVCNSGSDRGKAKAEGIQGGSNKGNSPQMNDKELRNVSRLLVEGGEPSVDVDPQRRRSLESDSHEEQEEKRGRRTRLSSQNQNGELGDGTGSGESPEKGKERMGRRKSTENVAVEEKEGEKRGKRTRSAAQVRTSDFSGEETSDESKERKLQRRKSTEIATVEEKEGEKRVKRTRSAAQVRNSDFSGEETNEESKERKLQRRKSTEIATVEEKEGEKRVKRTRSAAQTQNSSFSSEETSDKDNESKERKLQRRKSTENPTVEEKEGEKRAKRTRSAAQTRTSDLSSEETIGKDNESKERKLQRRKSTENTTVEEKEGEKRAKRTRSAAQTQNCDLSSEETIDKDNESKERKLQRRKSTENPTVEEKEGEKRVKRTRSAAKTQNSDLSSEETSDKDTERKERKSPTRKSEENNEIQEKEGEKRAKRTRSAAQVRTSDLSGEETSDESKEGKLQRRKSTENTTTEEKEGEKRAKRTRSAAKNQNGDFSGEETSDRDNESKERKSPTRKSEENGANEENDDNRNRKKIKVTVVKEDDVLQVSDCDQPGVRSSRRRSASAASPARPVTRIRRSSRLMNRVEGSPLTIKSQASRANSSTSSESEGETRPTTSRRSTHTATLRS